MLSFLYTFLIFLVPIFFVRLVKNQLSLLYYECIFLKVILSEVIYIAVCMYICVFSTYIQPFYRRIALFSSICYYEIRFSGYITILFITNICLISLNIEINSF